MGKQQEDEFDVLVVGTGASGMSAAVTAAHEGLKVLVVDKAALFGGTTARSGGWLWIPGTKLAKEQGIQEPAGAARAYLKHEATTHFDAARVDAFVENGPKAIDFFTEKTCVQFDMPPVFPDYHAEAPGGQQGGRSMVTRPFDGLELGERIAYLAPPVPELTVFGMMLGSGKELWHFLRAFKSLESFWYVSKRFGGHLLDVVKHGRGMTLTNGNALAGRLAKAGMDLNIPVWLSSPVKKLIVEGNSVVGATVVREGKPVEIRVRRGVVLACGGFPYDVERRKQLFPHAPTGREHFTPSPELNTGDGLRLGESVGGWVDPAIPNAAAWCPTSVTQRKDGSQGVMPHFIDRAKPGVIAITPRGRRFTNEALSYHDFIQDLVKACKGLPEVTCWLICDHAHLREYGLGCVAPFPLPIGHHLKTGYLKRANSLEELAKIIDVPAAALQGEVETFNRDAATGVDTKFGKGSTAYNRFQGDSLVKPNPCMAPIRKGPFYALKVVVGEIGTFAGLATDASCRVLNKDKQIVRGLFAIGNDAASIMGGNYPGAGITLGPALTFGYVAGKALAASEPLDIPAPLRAAPRPSKPRMRIEIRTRQETTPMNTSIPSMPALLAGRTALVTGAGQGNGRTIAEGLARAGATVVVTDMNEQNARSVAEGIRSAGGDAKAYCLDVTSSDECRALAAITAAQVGQIDILINNAGIIIRENTGSERAEANWKKTIDVNVHGTFNVTMAWLQDIKQTRGSIVNIASIAAYAGQAASLGYSPSKGAIKMLTQSLASELAAAGVRVNALAPGVIETPMTASTRDDPKRLETFMTRIPMGRVGQPEDLVGPVLFLVSDMSRYVTGITLPVDGGFLAV